MWRRATRRTLLINRTNRPQEPPVNIHFVAFPILIDHVSHDHRRARSGLIYPLRRGDRPLADVIPLRVAEPVTASKGTVAA